MNWDEALAHLAQKHNFSNNPHFEHFAAIFNFSDFSNIHNLTLEEFKAQIHDRIQNHFDSLNIEFNLT